MTSEERDLITSLFDRLRQAEQANPQKDREAEQLIQRQVSAQPGAPYLFVQTLLVQDHALHNAQARLADLERQLAAARENDRGQSQAQPSGGGFLSGLLGGNRSSQPPPLPQQAPPPGGAVPVQSSPQAAQPVAQVPGQPAYPSTVNMPPSAGGGFLRSAMAAAAGVAGGSLLFQGIQNLMGGSHAGPFGGSFMGNPGGYGGGGGMLPAEHTDIVNNYYGSDAAADPGATASNDFESRFGQDATTLPADYDPGSDAGQDAGFQDVTDDGGGSFDDGGGTSDDTSV